MKLTAMTAALSLVASVFLLSACDRGPDQGTSAGGTADQSQSQGNTPKRSPSKP